MYRNQIGNTAGTIWQYLDKHESASITKLKKEIGVPADQVLQGLGWLAREDKIVYEGKNRGFIIRLKK